MITNSVLKLNQESEHSKGLKTNSRLMQNKFIVRIVEEYRKVLFHLMVQNRNYKKPDKSLKIFGKSI